MFQQVMKKLVILGLCLLISKLLFNLSILQLVLITIIIVVVARHHLQTTGDSKNYPPGPRGLPLLGCLPWLIFQDPDDYLRRMSSKYGKIVSINLGSTPMFVVNDYELIKQIGNDPRCQLRPDIGIIQEVSNGFGIVGSEGNLWKHQRRYFLHAMRDSGMGKLPIEQKIMEELVRVVDEIERSEGSPMSVADLLEKSTCNIIYNLAFDKVFDYDDPEFTRRIRLLNRNANDIGVAQIMSYMPWLYPLSYFQHKHVKNSFEDSYRRNEEFIEEHRKVLGPDDPRDFLDSYLIEIRKARVSDETDEYQKTFTEEQLKHTILDMFNAGTTTSSTTIRWAILYMIRYPEIQKKLHAEIDDVVGTERVITMADKPNLPYTTAILQEVERLGSVVPRAIPRSNDVPIGVNGYHIPRRSVINFNIYAVHRDANLWKNPDKFDPRRFIDDKGKAFRPPYLIPFGSGKRACAGEALARMEIFLLFANLMQKFRFEEPNGKIPELKHVSSVLRGPEYYEIRAYPRSR